MVLHKIYGVYRISQNKKLIMPRAPPASDSHTWTISSLFTIPHNLALEYALSYGYKFRHL